MGSLTSLRSAQDDDTRSFTFPPIWSLKTQWLRASEIMSRLPFITFEYRKPAGKTRSYCKSISPRTGPVACTVSDNLVNREHADRRKHSSASAIRAGLITSRTSWLRLASNRSSSVSGAMLELCGANCRS